ncbi:MAG: hypothetical protein EZS28_004623 [Streblomastix strix]|uniref:DDE-1 domain-containing protein n=1 Tax=Streblomastix strix TaxID=222440 RepID=A0A5J4WXP0_9EUKA|nr:MAG: hypothetical protein EZS28_004623 [Streblomastix strix]
MVSSLGSSKYTKVKKKNLALCDCFLLIDEIAKLGKSTKIKKKIQTIPKQIREEIFKRWKIAVSGNFHKYLIGRHIDKLIIKRATSRQVQRMLIRAEYIQKHLTNLKITVKGKKICIVINRDEIGIQAYCDTRDQCFIIPAEYKDDEIHMAADRSEIRVSTMIAVILDYQLLLPFLNSKQSVIQQELQQNNVIQNENVIVVSSTSGMINIDLMLQWVRDVLIKFVKLQRQKYRLQNRYEAVLIVDNMTAHRNNDVKDLLKANSTILLTLQPHQTHFTQPCDVGIFGTLKQYYQQNREGIAKFTLAQIATHIIDASQKAASLQIIKNRFPPAQFSPQSMVISQKLMQICTHSMRTYSNSCGTYISMREIEELIGNQTAVPYTIPIRF